MYSFNWLNVSLCAYLLRAIIEGDKLEIVEKQCPPQYYSILTRKNRSIFGVTVLVPNIILLCILVV
jgi:hypothetical protein